MNDMTIDDLMTLVEAMEAWETKDATGELMGSLFGAMLMRDSDPDAKAKYDAEEKARKMLAEEARNQRKERSILLRAKLIQQIDVLRAARLGGVVS